MKSNSTLNTTLTIQAFYVLLAVAPRPMHGYGIVQQVAEDSQSRLILAPGTVYGVLKRLQRDGLVRKTISRAQLIVGDKLISYQITDSGQKMLRGEMKRWELAVLDARQRLELYS